jgi:sugar phosphate isomerase/epimerase
MAEAGYKYAGLMTHKGKTRTVVAVETTPEEAAAIGEEVRKRGLQTVSVYGGDFGVAKGMDAGMAGLKGLIDNCVACRCPDLMISGTGPELFDAYYKVVAECCDYAAPKGISLSVKPHGRTSGTGPQLRKVIETVGRKNFRVWYDPGNILFYNKGEVDPVEDVLALNGLIAGMSIKDFKAPQSIWIAPGTGQVNFREMMARAKKGGFTRGPLVVECLQRGEGVDLIAEARKARGFLEQLTGA